MDPVGVDQRWDAMGPLHDYLRDAFPHVCVPFFIELHSSLMPYIVATPYSN